eukprot:5128304-Ditylum_brightwellii.AAC.1
MFPRKTPMTLTIQGRKEDMQKYSKIKCLSQELGEVKAKFDEIAELLTKTCSAQKSMVDTIQKC